MFVRKLAQVLPVLSDYLGEDIKAVMRQMNVVIPGYVAAALKEAAGDGRVFAELVRSKVLSEEEKSMYRLAGEGFNFLSAGTETTSVCFSLSTALNWSVVVRC